MLVVSSSGGPLLLTILMIIVIASVCFEVYSYNSFILKFAMSLRNGPIENDDDEQQVLPTKADGLGFIEPLTTLAEEFSHSPGHQRKIRLMAEKVRLLAIDGNGQELMASVL